MMKITQSKNKNDRKSVTQPQEMCAADIIKYGMSNENAVKLIEKENTLVFVVEKKATKKQIKDALFKLYKADIKKVRTLISMKGYKKAYVVLKKEGDATKIANYASII